LKKKDTKNVYLFIYVVVFVDIGWICDVFYDVHKKNDSIEMLELKQDMMYVWAWCMPWCMC